MNSLSFDITAPLSGPVAPDAKTPVGSRVRKIFVAKSDYELSPAGDVPTADEMEDAILYGYVVMIEGIVNGRRIDHERIRRQGDSTEYGKTTVDHRRDMVRAKATRFNNETRLAFEKIDRLEKVRMWYVTEKNYLFGGANGYETSPVISPIRHSGYGSEPYYRIEFSLKVDGSDEFAYDDYLDLTNVGSAAVVTADNTLITIDNTILTADRTE